MPVLSMRTRQSAERQQLLEILFTLHDQKRRIEIEIERVTSRLRVIAPDLRASRQEADAIRKAGGLVR